MLVLALVGSSLPEVGASASVLGAPTLFGTVNLPDGSPASGARVVATAAAADVGSSPEIIPLVTLGETMTGPDGTFAFALAPDSSTALPLVNAAGVVNVSLIAVLDQTPRLSTVFGVPLDLEGNTFVAVTNPLSLSLDSIPTNAAASYADCRDDPEWPSRYKAKFDAPAYAATRVAELHAWDDMTSSFVYKEGGEHKIDIGVRLSQGGWKIGGTSSITKDSSLSQGPTAIQGRYGRPQRPIVKYQQYAYCNAYNGQYIMDGATVEAEYASGGFEPGANFLYKDGPRNYLENNRPGKMGNYGPAYYVEKDKGITERVEGAVEVFGFSAGAMSQYSQKLKFTWTMGVNFGSATDFQYHLWGNGADPESSQTLFAYSGPEPVVITPATQTTSSGDANWTVKAGQDSAGATTLKMEFGDGLSETRTIPQGSVTSTFTFSHRFISGTGTYAQRATIVETGASATSTTTRTPLPGPRSMVGYMKLKGNNSTNIVTVTGLGTWDGGQQAAAAQTVSAAVAQSTKTGTFDVYTAGINTTDKYLHAGTYDINVQNGTGSSTYGYTNHTTWTNPGGDCMTWTIDGNTKKVGTAVLNPGTDGVIDSVVGGTSLGGGWFRFTLPSGMNASPGSYEQAVCISSIDSANGNMAPLDIV
ncbi:MAG TPA: hypothetical protein VM142_10475 [Acidimicrobiales bacterium]|nr:hypothetical protein [Acidimicrobiales bacterium]